MALTRKTLIQFGNAGPTSSYGQFGSKEAGTPQTSQDPTVIQQLTAWIQGWQDAVVAGDKAPYLEDMNGWCYVHSYMMAYLFQSGIAEWDSGTTYQLNSIVQDNVGGGQWFKSLQINNLNNVPPVGASNAFWRWLTPPQEVVGSATVNKIPKVTSAASTTGTVGSAVLGDSSISDDGVDVILTLPLKFPDATIQTTAAVNNAPTNQSVNLAGLTRTLATNYYNTTLKPIYVSVVVFGTNAGVFAFVNAATTPTTPTQIVSQQYNNGAGGDACIFFIVLPGFGYRVQKQFGALTTWTEWT